ncbi:Uncharacterized conserved protein [Rhodospirillales bacterium URHD0017]|nr:Uncharacterized conserved protein [Rhodospirillales bacterium URHD0017]
MDRPTVRLPLHGRCLCGAINYRLNGAPLLVYVCHCHDCQTRSGSAFSLNILIQTADLTVSGSVNAARRTTPKGREVEENTCPVCGTFMLAHAVAAPDYTSLRAGTLDDASWAIPIAQAYVSSAIPWAVIPGVPQLIRGGFDYAAMSEAWRATAPPFAET